MMTIAEQTPNHHPRFLVDRGTLQGPRAALHRSFTGAGGCGFNTPYCLQGCALPIAGQ